VTFSIDSSPSAKGYVITIGGVADTMAAPEFERAVTEAVREVLETGLHRMLVVDLSEATFVDSRMIGAIVKWAEDLRHKGWQMPLVCDDPNMLRVFRAIGLEQVLDIRPTLEDAQAS
jgi:anti-sigma B factor antagonist